MVNGDDFMPKECFFTKGVGRHSQKLMSFELALRDAGIEKQNLVRVSSIYPTSCKIVPAKEGLPKLQPGQITFVVLAESATDEPNRLVCAGIGLANAQTGGETPPATEAPAPAPAERDGDCPEKDGTGAGTGVAANAAPTNANAFRLARRA